MNALKTKLGTMLSAGFALVIVIGLLVATFGRTQLAGLGTTSTTSPRPRSPT